MITIFSKLGHLKISKLLLQVAVFALIVAVTFAQDYDNYEPRARAAPPRVQPGYSGPAAPKPTPVAILKQINRHNEDGSYTYGYEGGDGSFKIETKLPTGEVKGKYGYVDDTGKVRVVEYGATKYGFEPSGEGITVAPPTLVDETTNKDGTFNQDYGGNYYEPEPQRAPAPVRHAPAPRPRPQPQPQQAFDYSPPQQFEPAAQSAPVPPRPQIPGAAPAPVQHHFDFGPPSRPVKSFTQAARPRPRPAPLSFPQPAPIEEDYEPAPAPRPAPRISYADPAPSRSSAPQFSPAARPPAPRPAPQQFAPAPRPSSYAPRPAAPAGRGGILDQLSKDYALPSDGSAPLHDISFGYY
ncbi:hypothetical protein NQ314_001212 [Rhamnusium bicolor]|uniref:Uncharacterized protein n=1 Tax=Rhamnusium bicolor TaxID=1586634 RepID=A0AAV8ZVW7_9CUCU|nr:hypothetical protein NQ314_001212 [Rhamnusium bicolor]